MLRLIGSLKLGLVPAMGIMRTLQVDERPTPLAQAMDAVLTQLRSEGYPIRPEDEARLSPFGHAHINMLGRYSFSVPDKVELTVRPTRINNLKTHFIMWRPGRWVLVSFRLYLRTGYIRRMIEHFIVVDELLMRQPSLPIVV